MGRIKEDLFNRTLKRILKVLEFNYLPDFKRQQLQSLNKEHTDLRKPIGFNSLDSRGALPDKTESGRQANIFGVLANNFASKKAALIAANSTSGSRRGSHGNRVPTATAIS